MFAVSFVFIAFSHCPRKAGLIFHFVTNDGVLQPNGKGMPLDALLMIFLLASCNDPELAGVIFIGVTATSWCAHSTISFGNSSI